MNKTIIKSDLNKIIIQVVGKMYYVDMWWESPNKAFDGRTPNELYYAGGDDRQRVIEYVLGNQL